MLTVPAFAPPIASYRVVSLILNLIQDMNSAQLLVCKLNTEMG